MDIYVHWCPRCNVQSERPWHLCERAAPLFPQTAVETECERIEVVRADTHQGAVEALTGAREALKDAHRPGHWHGVLKARSILSDALDRAGGQFRTFG